MTKFSRPLQSSKRDVRCKDRDSCIGTLYTNSRSLSACYLISSPEDATIGASTNEMRGHHIDFLGIISVYI